VEEKEIPGGGEMTERKLTDNEVIKALECCASSNTSIACKGCPFDESGVCCEQENAVLKVALVLINRQKTEIDILIRKHDSLLDEISEMDAEIERLNAVSEICGDCHKQYAEKIERAKSEAIKEFAERLKKKTYPFPCAIGVENAVTIRAINNLVKEMTEGKDE
jgi:hypothetical protein